MPWKPGAKGQAAIEPGFENDGKGAGIDAAPVGMVVAQESSKLPQENRIVGFTRTMKVTNRAEKGPCKGRPFLGSYGGVLYPEGADAEDEATWLQPGESMTIERDAAFHFFGRIFDPLMPDKQDVIRMYGDYQWEGVPDSGLVGRIPKMRKIGPPPLPDLMIVQVDQRGREIGETASLYDRYM